MRVCTKCGEEKDEIVFTRSRGKPSTRCKSCVSLYKRGWNQRNPDRMKSYVPKQENWRKRNMDRVRIAQKERRALDPERYRKRDRERYDSKSGVARTMKWRQSNLESFKAIDHAYRARRREAVGRFTKEDVLFLFSSQRGLCVVCETKLPKGYCVDHIMPLALGGTNDKHNLQLLCRSCNARKSKKHPIEFMQQIGRLL